MVWGVTAFTGIAIPLQSEGAGTLGSILVILLISLGIGAAVYYHLDESTDPGQSEGGFHYEDYAPMEFLDPFATALGNQIPDQYVDGEFINGKTYVYYIKESGEELGRVSVDEQGHISIEVRNGVGELYEIAEVTPSNYREYTPSEVADDVVERFNSRASDVLAA